MDVPPSLKHPTNLQVWFSKLRRKISFKSYFAKKPVFSLSASAVCSAPRDSDISLQSLPSSLTSLPPNVVDSKLFDSSKLSAKDFAKQVGLDVLCADFEEEDDRIFCNHPLDLPATNTLTWSSESFASDSSAQSTVSSSSQNFSQIIKRRPPRQIRAPKLDMRIFNPPTHLLSISTNQPQLAVNPSTSDSTTTPTTNTTNTSLKLLKIQTMTDSKFGTLDSESTLCDSCVIDDNLLTPTPLSISREFSSFASAIGNQLPWIPPLIVVTPSSPETSCAGNNEFSENPSTNNGMDTPSPYLEVPANDVVSIIREQRTELSRESLSEITTITYVRGRFKVTENNIHSVF
ncbi:hypothetical protein HK096_005962 [Nowakowskiella sp. JEL0078]|nr:hypothetical protein HK096_005962 [Nowakowskiella sp. JEL0078]